MADEINNLTPGQPLTPEQREKLAKSNIEATTEAQRLAAEHIERDRQEGKGEPAVKAVADMLKDKLLKEDIHPPEDGVRSKSNG